jgi:hypothetical protein
VQGLNVYSSGWTRGGANPSDFKGNCIRNCVIATNRIVLLEGGGTTHFTRNLMIFGPVNTEYIYASSLATYHSKVLHTLVFSENVMVHHGGAAFFFFHGELDTPSRIVLRNNTFHGKTENLAVVKENALTQQIDFVNNLGINCSNLVFSDPKYLRSTKLRSSGNQSLTSENSDGSQRSIFNSTTLKVLSNSPFDRNAWRIDSKSVQVENEIHSSGALPFGPVDTRGDWFTDLQDRFKAALQHNTVEARAHWSRSLDASR